MSETNTGYLVVVGLGRSGSAGALRWAVTEAAIHGGRARALRAWRPLPSTAGARGTPSAITGRRLVDQENDQKQQLSDDVARVLGADHTVEMKLVLGGRRRALLAESSHADLLVVDSPDVTSLSNSPLRVQRLARAAACPVVVMPRKVTGEPDTALGKVGKSIIWTVARAAGQSGRPGVRPPSIARGD